MARSSRKSTARRPAGFPARFAPDLLPLEDRSVPASIYVSSAFAGSTPGASPGVGFVGTGALSGQQVPAGQLTFVDASNQKAATGAGQFAAADVTVAFNVARDNPGADTIFLAGGTFKLDNTQGQSLTLGTGFNDNTYFFNTDPLSILGTGKGASTILPQADTLDPADPLTRFDPVFSVRNGATFVGSDFTFDGAGRKIGTGIGASGGTKFTLSNTAVNNFVSLDGLGNGGDSEGTGVAFNANGGASVLIANSSFAGNGRVGVGFTQSDGQVLNSTFTGRGAGTFLDYGLQVLGASNVFASGNTLTNYKAFTSGAAQSAAVFAAQSLDNNGKVVAGGANLLLVGNSLTGNIQGVTLGQSQTAGSDTSVAVLNFNDLSNNVVGLDSVLTASTGTTTGVDAGIDARFNYFGSPSGPQRAAGQNTAATGDEQVNPAGTGSAANGNVRISNFIGTAAPQGKPLAGTQFASSFGTPGGAALGLAAPAALAAARATFVSTTASTLTIFVNGTDNTFTDNGSGKTAQAFNPSGVGQPTVAAAALPFVPANTPYGSFVVPADGRIAVPDLTTAFDIARDNPGADTILLASSPNPFGLTNFNGQSATLNPPGTPTGQGFNDNTYFFTGAVNGPLTVRGSGAAATRVTPLADTLNADAGSETDPVFAVRQGATFAGSDFTLDGAGRQIGTGIGASGGTGFTLTNAAVSNFASTPGNGTGVLVQSNATSPVTVTGSTFSGNAVFGLSLAKGAGAVLVQNGTFAGNGQVGVGFSDTSGQVVGGTFTGKGAGAFVDYGVQVLGASQVFVTGITASNYKGVSGGVNSAPLLAAQSGTGNPNVLAAGNKLAGNGSGVIDGQLGGNDQSVVVAYFNDLTGTTVALDATQAKTTGTTTGVDAGIDGRFNFFDAGNTGPLRTADTPATGDETINPAGQGGRADGNVDIRGFRRVTAPTTFASSFGTPGGATLAVAAAALRAAAVAAPASLVIYVDPGFTGTQGAAPNQPFNPSGVGAIGTVPAAGLKFEPTGTAFAAGGVTASGSYAVPDLTTALNIARDNLGDDQIFLAPGAFTLDNSQAGGPTFAPNSYLFPGAANALSISGSGLAVSVVRPTAATFNPADLLTSTDAPIVIQQGGLFSGRNFTLDGSATKLGAGLGVFSNSGATLDTVAIRNVIGQDGTASAGSSVGAGLVVNNDNPLAVGTAAKLVTVTNSQFSNNGKYGVLVSNATAQVAGSTFTGRGAGLFTDYGVQAQGASKLYVTGSKLSEFQGVDPAGLQSAAVSGFQFKGTAVGPQLVLVGNSLTNNRQGVDLTNEDPAGTATSLAQVRFNDLSGNVVALSTTNPSAGIVAPNNYFGGLNGPAGAAGTGGTGAPVAGSVLLTDGAGTTKVVRPVTAPTLSIPSDFASTAIAADTAATTAGGLYVTDPRIQSGVFLTTGATGGGGGVAVIINFTTPLARNLSNTGYQFDPTRVSVLFTRGATSTQLTAGQFTVTPPTAGGDGRTATVTVSQATLAALGANGTLTVTVQPSSTSANTGNEQLANNGFQTAGPVSLTVPFGAANAAPVVSIAPTTASVTPTAPVTFTVTVTPTSGRTITTVTPTSSNPAVTLSAATRVAGSPDSAPVFTFTASSTSLALGSALVTVAATDSDGLSGSASASVAFGVANRGPTLDGGPANGVVIPVNGSTTQTFTATARDGRTITSVTAVATPGADGQPVVTITQGGTATSPTFTVTGATGRTGSTAVTVTATDSDGLTATRTFNVQVGDRLAPTITDLPDTTIPFNGSTGPLTVTVGGVNQPIGVTGTSSNTGVATVSVVGSGNTRTVTVTANPALTTGGSATISLTATDAQGLSTVDSFTVTVAPQRVRLFAAAAGPGSGPVVQVYGQNGVKGFGFTAFELSFTGGVVVATGDVNGDGYDDVVAGANVGGGPRVRIIDGKTGVQIANFFAFEESFRGGVTVAVGKVLDTGTSAGGFFREQIIIGAGNGGGPRVSVFDLNPATGQLTRTGNFLAYEEAVRNGASVAAADLNGDGLAEVITGAGVGGAPRVRAFSGTGTPTGVDFFAFDSGNRGGVNVAAGLLGGTATVNGATVSVGSIVAGSGENNGSLVRVFSNTGTQTAQFVAYPEASNKAVRVGTGQFTAGGTESVLTGPGAGGGPLLRVFSPAGAGPLFQDFAFEPPFRGGIFVG